MAVETRVIDKQAQLLFEGLITPDWVAHEESEDNGIDYRVERFTNQTATGHYFFAQLKGQLSPDFKGKGKFVSYDLEFKHLRQYHEMRAPVYLVIADLKNQKAYWAFVQRVTNEMRIMPWKTRKEGTLAIRVFVTNLVDTSDAFYEQVLADRRYMSSLRIMEGIQDEERRLNQLDENFIVAISATGTQKHYTISPRGDVALRGVINKSKFEDRQFINLLRGLPAKFTPRSMTIDGSPLWQWVIDSFGNKSGFLEIKFRREGQMQLKRMGKDKKVRAKSGYFPCLMEGGQMEMRYSSKSPFGLLALKGAIRAEEIGRSPFHAHCDGAGWANLPLFDLPLFEELSAIFCEYEDGDFLRMDFAFDGLPPTSLDAPYSDSASELVGFVQFVGILKQARKLAEERGIEPKLPVNASPAYINSLSILLDLLDGKTVELEQNIESVTGSPELDQAREILSQYDLGLRTNLVSSWTYKADFFGETMKVEHCLRCLTDTELNGNIEEFREQVLQGKVPTSIKFVSTKESTFSIRRMTDEESSEFTELSPDPSPSHPSHPPFSAS